MIIVHHLNNSRSQRVLWLLEELGLEYDIKYYQRDKETMLAPPELRAVHPLGKSPVITDGDVTVAETGAIVEYLLDTYGEGRLRPARGTPEGRQFTYWLHYAEGSIMPLMVMTLVFRRIETAPLPFFVKPVARGIVSKVHQSYLDPNVKTHLDFVEAELGKTGWFAGDDFSAADIQMSFPLEAAMARVKSGGRPVLAAFLERIHARPAYQAALKRGGPYEILGG
ncbi:MAG: glutathione S-transferase [Burkholderiales bacterium]|nr:glutathione S-transferase [Burkholderiales bacterium]